MSVSRRGFLPLLAGAVAAASVSGNGHALIAATAKNPTKVRARHLWQYDIPGFTGMEFHHRIDVIIGGRSQYAVDFGSDSQKLEAWEVETALAKLDNYVTSKHGESFEFDVRSFTLEQLNSGEAAKWFGRLGE
jgi:hypothetical protein